MQSRRMALLRVKLHRKQVIAGQRRVCVDAATKAKKSRYPPHAASNKTRPYRGLNGN